MGTLSVVDGINPVNIINAFKPAACDVCDKGYIRALRRCLSGLTSKSVSVIIHFIYLLFVAI